MIQIAFPQNKQLLFIQISEPAQLAHGCWAGPDQRVMIIGKGKEAQSNVTRAISRVAVKNTYMEEPCFGTNINSIFKVIIANEPQKIRDFLDELEKERILSGDEKQRAVIELGIRGSHIQLPHAFGIGGAGI